MADSKFSGYHIDRVMVTFINNGIFGALNEKEELSAGRYRQGSTPDAISVQKAVEYIIKSDSDYIYEENLSAEDIKQHFRTIRSKIDQSSQKYDCLIVIISSHGNKDVVFGSDECPIKIQEIIEPFHNNEYEGLRGKAKLFVINGCRGDQGLSSLVYDGSQMVTDLLKITSEARTATKVHTKGDYAVIYSASPDAKSGRDPKLGSPLIRHFFGEIRDLAKNNQLSQTSLIDIFDNMMERYTEVEKESLPGIERYLRHKVYLPSKGKFYLIIRLSVNKYTLHENISQVKTF